MRRLAADLTLALTSAALVVVVCGFHLAFRGRRI